MDKKRKSKAASDENPHQDENRPAKKKKKQKQANNSAMILIAAGAAVFLLLLCAVGVSAFFWWPPQNANGKQAKVDPNKDNDGVRIAPRIEDGPPGKKGGKDIVNDVRGAVYRTERKSELRNIGTYYNQFCDEYKGNARTYDNFLASMKREFGPIHDAIKDGYYQMNMKANLQRGDIIAYERDEDSQGHLCVRANGDIGYVPAAQLKKELGIK